MPLFLETSRYRKWMKPTNMYRKEKNVHLTLRIRPTPPDRKIGLRLPIPSEKNRNLGVPFLGHTWILRVKTLGFVEKNNWSLFKAPCWTKGPGRVPGGLFLMEGAMHAWWQAGDFPYYCCIMRGRFSWEHPQHPNGEHPWDERYIYYRIYHKHQPFM